MSTASKVIRPEIQAMHAYPVSDATGLVKLDLMESPYRLPEPLAAEIGRVVSKVAMNRYPIPSANELRALVRQVMQVPAGCDVLLGNGSDECIQYITAAIARDGAVVMAPAPSFAMFSMHALFYRLRFVGVALREDFSLDTDAFLAAMAKEQPSLVWIAFPNNPTGNAFPVADIERIIRAAPGLVVIDEAYQPFAVTSRSSMCSRNGMPVASLATPFPSRLSRTRICVSLVLRSISAVRAVNVMTAPLVVQQPVYDFPPACRWSAAGNSPAADGRRRNP